VSILLKLIEMVDKNKAYVYYPAMRVAGLIFFIFILLPCFANADHEGFSVMDVEFPAMIGEGDRWVEPEDNILYASTPITFDVVLYLSVHGTVDSVQIDSVDRVKYVYGVQNSLKCLQFYPGKIKGETSPFILPIELTFFSERGSKSVNIRLPYSSRNNERNYNLIYKALMLNNIQPPELLYFPSYFHKLPDKIAYGGYDYSIYKVRLDTLGKLMNVETITETEPRLSDRIHIVLDFAEFAPLVFRGVPQESEQYLIIRFFDTNYPTHSWPPASGSNVRYPVDYINIEPRLFLDTVINPPIPINMPNCVYHYNHQFSLQKFLTIDIDIDTNGTISKHRVLEESSPIEYSNLKKFLEYLKYTPARDINNRLVDYHGRIVLKRLSSNNIRIDNKWLLPCDNSDY